jgi:C4-type Zn-finger protein
MDTGGSNAKLPTHCDVCGGKLVVIVDVPRHATPYDHDEHLRTVYLRCEKCAYIKVVDM